MACGDYLKWIKDNRITIEDQNLIEIDEESEKVSKCPKCKAIFTLIRLVHILRILKGNF